MIDDLFTQEIGSTWKHAVRAYNTAENSELHHSITAMKDIVVKLSQIREYCETMKGDSNDGV